jgi:hypothetical protein
MIKEPLGISSIPYGFSGYHFFPWTPVSSPFCLDPQLVSKKTNAIEDNNSFFRLNFDYGLNSEYNNLF